MMLIVIFIHKFQTGYIMSLDEKTPIQQNDYCVESDGYLLFPLTPDPLDEVLQKTIGRDIPKDRFSEGRKNCILIKTKFD